ncbi:hypothetical protein Klosneuvirus_2_251 [Klosneuvirus KNV1]|uniref:Uncharacterized protein n=1 Tax=Klosneuvirus KNV1 TaxID=1977640 RepID=A0A1V0SJB9_9VIRU|nr:hypothetical protein Klosneuvirus_2_251 [Klosneuvirus KNV1]
MSRFVWAKPNSLTHINEFIKWLSEETSENYYLYRLCCQRNQLELPNELWKYILHHTSDNILFDTTKILYWFDLYSRATIQQQRNPIIIYDKWEEALQLSKTDTPIDIIYVTINVPVKLKELKTDKSYGMWYEAIIPVGAAYTAIDLILGIENNDSITKILFQHYFYITNIDDEEMQIPTKFTLIDHHNTTKSYLTLKQYMPISSYSAPYNNITLYIKSNDVIDSVNVLCGYMNDRIRHELGNYYSDMSDMKRKPFTYKRCKYNDGCIWTQ